MPSPDKNFPHKNDRTLHQRCLSRARDEPAETPLAPARTEGANRDMELKRSAQGLNEGKEVTVGGEKGLGWRVHIALSQVQVRGMSVMMKWVRTGRDREWKVNRSWTGKGSWVPWGWKEGGGEGGGEKGRDMDCSGGQYFTGKGHAEGITGNGSGRWSEGMGWVRGKDEGYGWVGWGSNGDCQEGREESRGGLCYMWVRTILGGELMQQGWWWGQSRWLKG